MSDLKEEIDRILINTAKSQVYEVSDTEEILQAVYEDLKDKIYMFQDLNTGKCIRVELKPFMDEWLKKQGILDNE